MVQHASSPFWQHQVRQLTFVQLVVPSSLCSPFGSSGGVDDLCMYHLCQSYCSQQGWDTGVNQHTIRQWDSSVGCGTAALP